MKRWMWWTLGGVAVWYLVPGPRWYVVQACANAGIKLPDFLTGAKPAPGPGIKLV